MNFPNHLISARRGFTLIELVVAMAITSLIIVALISISSMALDHWNRSRAEVRAERQAKALLGRMALDLEAMVVPKWNSLEWFVAEFDEGVSGIGLPEDGGSAKLVFFTAPTDRYQGESSQQGGHGDVSAVSYSVRYRDATGENQGEYASRIMYRHLVDPDEAFKELLGKPQDKPDLAAAYASLRPGEPRADDFICENLVRFKMVFHVSPGDGGEVRRIALGGDSGEARSVRIRGGKVEFSMNVGSQMPINGRIEAVEVSVAVLSDSAMVRLRKGNFKSSAARDEFIHLGSFRYSKLIELPRA